MMSFRFDKKSAQDFGLTHIENDIALDPLDNSKWQAKALYDFGWGKESGYCKLPIPDFPMLFNIALNSKNNEDMYGAAAIILEKYPEELLNKCEQFIDFQPQSMDLKKLSELFNLKNPTNRCAIMHKSYSQISSDFERWKKIAEHLNQSQKS